MLPFFQMFIIGSTAKRPSSTSSSQSKLSISRGGRFQLEKDKAAENESSFEEEDV